MIATQYSFPLPVTPAYSVTDFMVSEECNAAAFDAVWRWPEWEQPVLFLHGPAACGKTHLAHIWAARSHAMFMDAEILRSHTVADVIAKGEAARSWIVDDVQSVQDEAALFHLLNAIREQKGYLLLTANGPASTLSFTLPDLCSRLAALPTQSLHSPDDAVLSAALNQAICGSSIAR